MEGDLILDPVDSTVELEPVAIARAVTLIVLGVSQSPKGSCVPEVVGSQATCSSIVDKLKVPARSDLARKCKIERPKLLTAQTKKCKSTVLNQTDPKSVLPAQCVKVFPNECLDVRSGKLFSARSSHSAVNRAWHTCIPCHCCNERIVCL